MRKLTSQEKKQSILLLLAGMILLVVIGVLTALCMPFFRRLSDPVFQQNFRLQIDALGFRGWLLVLAIQMLQIIIAFIPGEPVELLAGVLYGAWGGLFTCLLGILLASAAVFALTRRYGSRLVIRIFGKEKVSQFKFLNNAQKVETVTFILFLIPGTPKDMLTYLAGISRIKASRFLLISTLARIPSVITSTLMGHTMSRGNLWMSLLIFLLIAAIGLFGILYKQKIIDHLNQRHSKETDSE